MVVVFVISVTVFVVSRAIINKILVNEKQDVFFSTVIDGIVLHNIDHSQIKEKVKIDDAIRIRKKIMRHHTEKVNMWTTQHSVMLCVHLYFYLLQIKLKYW